MWRNQAKKHSSKTISVILLFVGCLCILQPGCVKRHGLGNVLRVAVREKYRSMDPAHSSDHYSSILVRRAYEGLLNHHYLKRPYVLTPLLAESLPTVSKDGRVYVFRIKKGVYFQQDQALVSEADPKGEKRELVAEDFVYSFKRLADPGVVSDGWWIFDGKVVGLNEWRAAAVESGRANYAAQVAGLLAIDRYTLQMKLIQASPVLLQRLTMPYASVVAREVVEFYGKEFGNHPVGTGPFRLESLTNHQLVWKKSPSFRQEFYPSEGSEEDRAAGRLADAGKPLPFVEKLVDDILIEDQPAWLNFLQGNHDFLAKIPKDNQLAVFDSHGELKKELASQGISLFTETGAWFNYVGMNMEDPVVGGPKNLFLRQALNLAFNEGPAIEKFYLGLAKKAESLMPPLVAGYDSSYRNPWREYNLVKAREILAKAGHPNGEGIPELLYDTSSAMTQRQIAEYFQRAAAQLGLKIKLNVTSWPEYLERQRKRKAQIWGASWVYDYPDAENGWQLLYGKNSSPGPNAANYSNSKMDALYEKVAVIEDGPQRRKYFAEMKKIYETDLPWVITVHQAETRLARHWLKNFKLHLFDQGIEKYLRIDIAERERAN